MSVLPTAVRVTVTVVEEPHGALRLRFRDKSFTVPSEIMDMLKPRPGEEFTLVLQGSEDRA